MASRDPADGSRPVPGVAASAAAGFVLGAGGLVALPAAALAVPLGLWRVLHGLGTPGPGRGPRDVVAGLVLVAAAAIPVASFHAVDGDSAAARLLADPHGDLVPRLIEGRWPTLLGRLGLAPGLDLAAELDAAFAGPPSMGDALDTPALPPVAPASVDTEPASLDRVVGLSWTGLNAPCCSPAQSLVPASPCTGRRRALGLLLLLAVPAALVTGGASGEGVRLALLPLQLLLLGVWWMPSRRLPPPGRRVQGAHRRCRLHDLAEHAPGDLDRSAPAAARSFRSPAMPRPLLTVLAAPGSGASTAPTSSVSMCPTPPPPRSTRRFRRRSPPSPWCSRPARRSAWVPPPPPKPPPEPPTACWWWAADGPLSPGRAPHREDLAWLLLAHARPLPATLFRPGAVLERGGFARHAGPAFGYAHACRQLACRTLPGRCEPVLGVPVRVPGLLSSDELRDRAEVSRSFADRCNPHDRDAVWHSCEATLGATATPDAATLRRAA